MWCFASALTFSFSLKGCSVLDKTRPAAFFRDHHPIVIRLEGDIEEAGIQKFYDAPRRETVIKMAVPGSALAGIPEAFLQGRVQSGDVYKISKKYPNFLNISTGTMGAAERMALDVPLNLHEMTELDWQELPGIGPKLATEIVCYRQKCGGFCAIDDLARVPGIGKMRLQQLRKYFFEIPNNRKLQDNLLMSS
jgi:competence protein ComEA